MCIGNANPRRVLQMSAKGFGGSTSTSGGKSSATRSGKAGGGGYAQSDARGTQSPPAGTPLLRTGGATLLSTGFSLNLLVVRCAFMPFHDPGYHRLMHTCSCATHVAPEPRSSHV